MKDRVSPVDADSTRVAEILRGASRGPLDPDIDLCMALAEIYGTDGQEILATTLEWLARDAHPN